mmetsp:Transcript_4380/g.6312  ORF Transcript_4380/g.6312 Transcript_4380/m.6312 type:complete len:490 (+) Transcript_4380:146-1615(+)|eukprot:CAMPEP_0194219078 /NCGR_PEP_ID=MMETSP0156-20130528/25161_1 /TAXON_ID=33649 /ORGANISM="Thalassionema nitzschioides, Strain L26-B" /LENGTH=489 /DNA_ID=CAMNT_0038948627 /DNA_START=112 /DNA_END=1581 /DNA_ORIENTATION=-
MNLDIERGLSGNRDVRIVRRRLTGTSRIRETQNQTDKIFKYGKKKPRRKLPKYSVIVALNIVLLCFIVSSKRRHRHCLVKPGVKPVIEFFLHGRGSGHWTGSWGLMEILLEKGYDLRVYATKPIPSYSKHVNSSSLLQILAGEQVDEKEAASPPIVNYSLVADIMPGMSVFEILSVLRKRLWRQETKEYPFMMISDGDFPGALQSYLYGIPSIYTTHGQMFTANPPPASLPGKLISDWNHQSRLNGRSSMWTTYQLGFNHVPFLSNPLPRPRLRSEILKMAHERAARIEAYQGFQKSHPLVVTYFRDKNGERVIKFLLQEGLDVVVFGEEPTFRESLPGRLIPVSDETYFVQFMGIADGIVASGGCILQAECVYAQIPMLALYLKDDTEHELNVYMSRELKYKDGKRLIYGFSFEELFAHSVALPAEAHLFLKSVRESNASSSFYETSGHKIDTSSFIYHNELLKGMIESSDILIKIIEKEKRISMCKN